MDAGQLARFMSKVQVEPRSGCWLWTGYVSSNGYGRFNTGGKKGPIRGAHRISYEHWRGPIPEGLDLDHLCRVRRCVNPEHLEPVTRGENLMRGQGRNARALRSHCFRGHEFTPENTYMHPRRHRRECRECCRVRDRERPGRRARASV